VLGVAVVEDHDGVAVGYTDDATGKDALRWSVIFWLSQFDVCVLPSQ
jgi:hypothetical protein